MSIQFALRQLRREKGVTMSELSRLSGVSRTYISELESGKANDPSVAVLTSLAEALGVPPSRMLGEPEERPSVEIPQSLLAAQIKYGLSDADVRDLAIIKFRNYQPVEADDWKFLFDAVKRSLPKDADIK